MDEGSIVLDFKSPPGTSLEETDRMLQKVDVILKENPDVQNSHVDSAPRWVSS